MGFDFYYTVFGACGLRMFSFPEKTARMLALAVDDPIELAEGWIACQRKFVNYPSWMEAPMASRLPVMIFYGMQQ
jgi:hypothetical protein